MILKELKNQLDKATKMCGENTTIVVTSSDKEAEWDILDISYEFDEEKLLLRIDD